MEVDGGDGVGEAAEEGGEVEEEEEEGMGQSSSPVERRVATRRAARRKSAAAALEARSWEPGSPSRGGKLRRRGARVSGGSSIAESEDAETVAMVTVDRLASVEEEEESVEEVVEDSTVRPEEDGVAESGGQRGQGEEEPEAEAEEIGETEAAQRLGRKRPRRSLPAPSPELGSGLTGELPALKRRRRREPASPAPQQQPAKKARRGRPPSHLRHQSEPQPPSPPPPESAAQPKPATKNQRKKKSRAADDDTTEEAGTVSVTVQRFTKPRAVEGKGGNDDEIPFANRGGVNAVDVLSKLCEELIETYMTKLEERGRAAEDAATRREQKTMYRALEAFQEEVRTRLLEHVRVDRARLY
jgi:hypothetical protein